MIDASTVFIHRVACKKKLSVCIDFYFLTTAYFRGLQTEFPLFLVHVNSVFFRFWIQGVYHFVKDSGILLFSSWILVEILKIRVSA